MSTKKTLKQKSALGRGLNALLGDVPFQKEEGRNPIQAAIPIDQIQVNPFQPRKDFDTAALQALCASIKHHGIIQPLTVRQLAPAQFQLIAGERRLQAAKLAQLEKIPAYIRTADDQQMLEMALVENIQRENLNPIEIALSYQRLLTECQIKQDTLGARVGKDRTTVNNYLRLLKLPPDIQIALRDQQINMGHARALINVEAVDTQLSIFKETIEKALSVRHVEALVRALSPKKAAKASPKAPKVATTLKHTAQEASAQLTTQLNTPVKIQVSTQAKGAIKITFANTNELHRILKILVKQ